ncbi:hypothetical protein [Hyphomonas sp.]|uniref:hypothetical protein n=1 Tax=Hyphomonas sp. TaxID=87 RepID=UPI00391CBD96
MKKTIASAAFVLATFGLAGAAPALAQGEDAAEAEVAEVEGEDTGEPAECIEEEDCVDAVEAEPAEAAAEEAVAPMPEAAADAPAEGGVVVVPGSTEESQPGGSTRPGTTPDN